MSHLKDLFREGEEVVIVDTRGNEYPIWVMRPSTLQQEEARERANGRLSKFKFEARDKTSDRYMSMMMAFDEIEDYDSLIEIRLKYDEADAHELAFNAVLYGTEGDDDESKWMKDERYFTLLRSIADRSTEIAEYNAQMEEAGSDERISSADDELLNKLLGDQQEFIDEVDVVKNRHLAEREAEYRTQTREEIIEDLIKKSIDLDGRMTWYEDYKNRMIYYACRYVDDHKRFYFENQEDVMELPSYVKTQLYTAYERIDRGTDDLKNLLSLPNS